MNESIDRLLNQKQVAEWIGMSEAWLEQCRFRGTGLPYVKIGKACRYRSSEIQKWIDAHTICSGI